MDSDDEYSYEYNNDDDNDDDEEEDGSQEDSTTPALKRVCIWSSTTTTSSPGTTTPTEKNHNSTPAIEMLQSEDLYKNIWSYLDMDSLLQVDFTCHTLRQSTYTSWEPFLAKQGFKATTTAATTTTTTDNGSPVDPNNKQRRLQILRFVSCSKYAKRMEELEVKYHPLNDTRRDNGLSVQQCTNMQNGKKCPFPHTLDLPSWQHNSEYCDFFIRISELQNPKQNKFKLTRHDTSSIQQEEEDPSPMVLLWEGFRPLLSASTNTYSGTPMKFQVDLTDCIPEFQSPLQLRWGTFTEHIFGFQHPPPPPPGHPLHHIIMQPLQRRCLVLRQMSITVVAMRRGSAHYYGTKPRLVLATLSPSEKTTWTNNNNADSAGEFFQKSLYRRYVRTLHHPQPLEYPSENTVISGDVHVSFQPSTNANTNDNQGNGENNNNDDGPAADDAAAAADDDGQPSTQICAAFRIEFSAK